ncbi:hypothetical protein GCM10010096_08070 [Alcaligenes pakistanensis]|uniref:Capsular biosynthesis protein n=1 Tax=Alcaligenes pakistanensis TaxID=1482717 RepID=A0A8H9IH00_9BURK|nr:stealth conserved region 3 domain-containing protein [Alcaligenes pakistanensis]GHC40097.1 hypothetical protein GCM10010096_08070 [Alcaligenes pakistanensis]
MAEEIDAVIMWVDGEDPIFRRQYENYAGIEKKSRLNHEGKGRHRNTGELVYCLRGIRKNAPWVRKIHVVTSGQIPSFVDFNLPGVELVIHSDIFPDLAYLPTFNSFAIDSCLHRIPGLTKKFIRFSDDFIVLNPVTPEDFLGADGQGVYYLGPNVPDLSKNEIPTSNYLETLAYNRALLATRGVIAAHAPQHVPQMRDIDVCMQIEREFSDEIRMTREAKFRQKDNINMLFLYPHFVAGNKKLEVNSKGWHVEPSSFVYYTWSRVRQALVGHQTKDWRENIRQAVADNVLFLNINDHFGENPNEVDVLDYSRLMSEVLAAPASFEISK